MRKLVFWAFAALVLSAGVVTGWLHWSHSRNLVNNAGITNMLPAGFLAEPGKGERLYHLGGCIDCHMGTPDVQGGPMLPSGGNALQSVAGVFYPPNITPDPSTGIGDWSLSDFVNAMRHGTDPDGRHYYPSFPYPYYSTVTLSDLAHLKAYIDSIEPVMNETPDHELAFPFDIRLGNLLWKALFHETGEFMPDSSRDEIWNSGSYIVNGLAHCGMCHTPKGPFFNDIQTSLFTGGPSLSPGDKPVPTIAGVDVTDIINALDEWSGAIDEDSSMFAVTLAFSRHLPFGDAEAVASYLSTLERQ